MSRNLHGLSRQARAQEQAKDFDIARRFHDAASQWYNRAGANERAAESKFGEAEGWTKEAEGQLAASAPAYILVANALEKAIQIYRSIPKAQRAALGVDEIIAALMPRLAEAGKGVVSNMKRLESPPIDLGKLVDDARSKVSGKPALEALVAFCNLAGGARVSEIKQSAIRSIQTSLTHQLFSGTHMSRDGRVVARHPPADGMDENSDGVFAQMVQHHDIRINIVTQGGVIPALEILHIEHCMTQQVFIELAEKSPIVPRNRATLFGRGLFAGYDRDFQVALHLLAPQLEHLVRTHLKNAKVKTTTLDQEGVETENGLSTLIDLPEAKEVFGEDLVFEIKALFCSAFGPNLRNEIAHGLIEEDSFYRLQSVYAWWLLLRIVVNEFWNRYVEKRGRINLNG